MMGIALLNPSYSHYYSHDSYTTGGTLNDENDQGHRYAITTLASDAVDGVTSSVKGGAGSIADAASSAATKLNEKAIRAAVNQMRTVLQIAADELRLHPVLDRPVTLTTSVDIGFTALEMQVVMEGATGAATDGTEKEVA